MTMNLALFCRITVPSVSRTGISIVTHRNGHTARGFTMIEMVAVLTIMAILAAALLPVLIKQLDRVAGEKETSQLESFADGLRQSIVTTKLIPDSEWAQVIATNSGLDISQVRTNGRSLPRIFLIDPAFQISASASPPPGYLYKQDSFGSSIQPISPRLMIISSLSQALPANPTNSPTTFNDLWNTPEGALPAGWTWSGRGDDLKIQRINLIDLFLELNLISDNPSFLGRYKIDKGSLVTAPSNSFRASFIDSTLLELYDDTTTLQYSEILHRSKTFSYAYGRWQGGQFLDETIHHPKAVDMQIAANKWFSLLGNNPWANSWSGNNPVTTSNVYETMISYMSNYVRWATNGFPATGAIKTALNNAQTDVAGSTTALSNFK